MRTLLWAALFALAPALAMGVLQPIVAPPGSVMWNQSLTVEGKAFAKAPAGCGTVSPEALVAVIPCPGGSMRVALDADSPEAKRFNRIRFDFNGTGRFSDASSIELKCYGDAEGAQQIYANFGPQKLTATLQGRELLLQVQGYTQISLVKVTPTVSSFSISFNAGLQGSALFGKAMHAVRVIDTNNNLCFSDRFPVFTLGKGFSPDAVTPGDAIIIDLGDGTFTKQVSQFYGHPVSVNGAWYNVFLSRDENTLEVTPYTGILGTMHIARPDWGGWLIGTKYILQISGNQAPCMLPADTYRFFIYMEPMMTDFSQPPEPMLMAQYIIKGSTPFTVQSGAVATPSIGTPLTAEVHVAQQGANCTFSLSLTDRGGGNVSLQFPGGKPLDKVPFSVYDSRGNIVYQNTFDNG